jgi:hypothetical protein
MEAFWGKRKKTEIPKAMNMFKGEIVFRIF